MDSVPLGVRKGAWTEEEDVLLKKCIEKFGEGKWSQVPLRAGLNRCRKSCRLRWLNYLRPNIKRGNFGMDEVDLIIRLHKLLGNRWSLIAGRLPGRTSNDVKNYWNTHLHKKQADQRELEVIMKAKTQNTMEKTKIIRPRPRTFSKNLPWVMRGKNTIIENIATKEDVSKPSPTPPQGNDDDGTLWWENMFVDSEINKGIMTWSANDHEEPKIGLIGAGGEMVKSGVEGVDDYYSCEQEDQSDWSDIFMENVDLWNLLGDEQAIM